MECAEPQLKSKIMRKIDTCKSNISLDISYLSKYVNAY